MNKGIIALGGWVISGLYYLEKETGIIKGTIKWISEGNQSLQSIVPGFDPGLYMQ